MLPQAFISLTNPCLPKIWSNTYPAFAGAYAMGSALFIFLIEYFAMKLNDEYEEEQAKIEQNNGSLEAGQNHSEQRHSHGHIVLLSTRTQGLCVIILEAGICFHSIIIGMALSVSTGSKFVSLLCALIFHQIFEGLGLGARIAELSFAKRSWRPWLMSLTYSSTAPIGIAIGLGIRYSYNPESEKALIIQGTLDSISAGILLYAAMVELLAADFIIDKKIRKSSKKNQLFCLMLVFLGAGSMALIGRFA
ncbi:hypothetical protein G9A89_002137 [Geosiphon pyriformis]|nr:hypothetical protein G9A89_002137 [Geosiphon pyriformis]